MNYPFITKRLTNDKNYKPPETTYQSTLSKEEIAKKLEGYTRVESNKLHNIKLNTHIRYFVINPKTGEKNFRLGGYLTKIGDNNEYLVLSNGNFSWSVQFANTIFYKKMSNDEFKEQVVTEIEDDIKKKMEYLMKENKELKKVIKKIKDTTIKNKDKKKS
jgi:hypothetical protein